MVVGTSQHIPNKGRISIMKIQNFTVQKRHSVIKLSYGILLVLISIIMASINPIEIVTDWFLQMRKDSFLYKLWSNPPYELFTDVWVFNYTNVPEYLSGTDKVMKINEIGPFIYKEVRTNDHMNIDKENQILNMVPRTRLQFLREKSIDDPMNIDINVPNIPLLALSTLAADKLSSFVNTGAYYSMSMLGSNVFKKLNVQKVFWGYKDPLVTLANTILPGWIDFEKIGLLDRIYADKNESAEVDLELSNRFSLHSWAHSLGLPEQGYEDWNSSIPCNRVKGTYEGFMLPPNFEKGRGFTIFRKQACRSFPFSFQNEIRTEYGITGYKYTMDNSAFSRSSPYDCHCTDDCLPEGFIDIGNCYYGFPIALSKPRLLDVDPIHQSYYGGVVPDVEKGSSYYILEPTVGVPLEFAIKIQINLAVRTSPNNPITLPVKDKVLPLFWLKLHCITPPPEIISLLKLRLVIAPPLYITTVVVIFAAGVFLTVQGFYRVWKPKYKIIPPALPLGPIIRRKSQERRRSSVHENIAFKDDGELEKEAVSLLAINEEDSDFVELIIDDNELE